MDGGAWGEVVGGGGTSSPGKAGRSGGIEHGLAFPWSIRVQTRQSQQDFRTGRAYELGSWFFARACRCPPIRPSRDRHVLFVTTAHPQECSLHRDRAIDS